MVIVMVIVIVIVVVVAVALIARTAQQRNQFRGRFGPEYDRVVDEGGNRREGERELLSRQSRASRTWASGRWRPPTGP